LISLEFLTLGLFFLQKIKKEEILMKFTIVGGSMSLQEVEGYKNWIMSYYPELEIKEMTFVIADNTIAITCNNGEISFQPVCRAAV
jgi:hypothetical protein